MSLEGTLETIALPDVLALLSVTAKTGELRVESGEGGGSVWLDAGRVAGYDVGKQKSPVDALFALLRLTEGSFKFQTNTEPLNSVEPLDVTPLMEQAEERLAEWPGIAEVVPSLSSELVLQESINDDIVLSPEQWRLIASIGSGRRVADLIEAGDLGEFDGCKAIKRLVETGLVHVVSSEVEPEPEALVQDVPALVQDRHRRSSRMFWSSPRCPRPRPPMTTSTRPDGVTAN